MKTYRLDVMVRVVEVTEYGQSGGLSVEHRMEVGAPDFMAVCAILAKFDELARRLRSEHKAAR